MPEAEQLQLIRSLKGPPAVILVLLMIRGASMTNVEICRYTGYSDKPVKMALETLEVLGFVQNNGHFNGWSLAAGARQLPLPMTALDEMSASAEPAAHPFIIRAAGRATDPGGQPTSGFSSNLAELSTGTPVKIGKIPILTGEDRKNSDLQAASGSAAVADLRSLKISDQQQQQRSGEDRKNSDIEQVVIHSGIRPPARALVLAAPPAVALAWWWESLLVGRELENPLGWFIQRIKGGEPPPADMASIARAWLELPAPARRQLLDTAYGEWVEFWFDHGVGPSHADVTVDVHRAGGFDYAEW